MAKSMKNILNKLYRIYRMSPNIGSQEGEKLLLLDIEKEKRKEKRVPTVD